MSHHRESVTASGAPEAVGPYVHAVKAGGLIFISGQIPLHPSTGELVGRTAAEQAAQCLENLKAIAEAAGAKLSDAVKCTVYLADIGDFAAVNDVYAGYFPDGYPARVAFGVGALPRGARVEIDAILAQPD
jgi:2-iminobutanoate/2-iminopropanoate deaminase